MTPSLRALALRWMAWAAVSRFGQDALRLAGRLALARLLWPEAFGLFTLAVAVVAAVQLCCQLQIDSALVQRRTVTDDVCATAFWSLAGLGAIGAVVLLALGGPAAALMGQAPVGPLIRMMSVQVAITGLALTPRALLWRDLNFRGLAVAGLISEGVGSVVAIAAALAGAGVMSFVIHGILVEAVDAVVMWRLVRWRPHRHWKASELGELVRFGAPLTGRRAIDLGGQQGERFVVGLAFGPDVLGLYTLAMRLVRSLGDGLAGVFSRVSFAAFARTRDDETRSRRGLLAAFRYAATVVIPIVSGLALAAEDLIPALLGRKWLGAIPILQILAVRAAIGSLVLAPRAVLLARGRQWHVVALSVWGLAALAVGWTLGLPWGPLGVAAGSTVAAATLVPIAARMASAEIPIGLAGWLRALVPALLGTAAVAVGVAGAHVLLSIAPPLGRITRLGVVIASAGLCYGIAVAPWVVREARYLFPAARDRRRREEAPPALGADLEP